MDPRLIDVLRGGVPALLLLVVTATVVRAACRRPPLRRLTLSLSLGAFAGSLALFHALVPRTEWLAPYVAILGLFALVYTAFKVAEILLCDVMALRRGRVPPPGILRDIVSALFAALVLVLLLRAILGVDATALVATSAALSIVLGLALQETLSNLFAGLALMVERPFEPGDWVRLGERTGRVTEVSWRAVKLQLLRQEDYLVVPNSVVAKGELVNLSQPTPLHGQSVEVGVVYSEAPGRVRPVLIDAALEVDGVLREPRPRAAVARFDHSAVTYRLTYWIEDFGRVLDIEGEVLAHVWYALRRHGIQVPFPVSDVRWRDAAAAEAVERTRELARVATLLRSVDFLAALTPEETGRLAGEVRMAPFPAGMTVVRQGEAGDSLFVICRGRVQVSKASPSGGPARPIAVIEEGDYFGEMSLLTGAPRSATIRTVEDTELLVLTKDALRPLLLGDPAVAERLSQAMAKRRVVLEEEAPTSAAEGPIGGDDLASFLLGSMRRFFGLLAGE